MKIIYLLYDVKFMDIGNCCSEIITNHAILWSKREQLVSIHRHSSPFIAIHHHSSPFIAIHNIKRHYTTSNDITRQVRMNSEGGSAKIEFNNSTGLSYNLLIASCCNSLLTS